MFHSCAVPLRDNYWIHYFTYLQYTCWLSTPFSHWSITSFHTCCIILPRVTITLYRSFASFVYFWFYLTHAKVRLRWCYLYSRTYKGTIHISLLTFLCLKLIKPELLIWCSIFEASNKNVKELPIFLLSSQSFGFPAILNS